MNEKKVEHKRQQLPPFWGFNFSDPKMLAASFQKTTNSEL